MRLPAAELADLLPTAQLGAVRPRELVLVDLGPGPVPEAAVHAASTSQDVLVGVAHGPLPPGPFLDHLALTLTTDPEERDRRTVVIPDLAAAEARLTELTSAHPQAAAVTRALLRLSSELPVADALQAESLAYSTLQAGPEHRAWRESRTRREPLPATEPVVVERDGDVLRVRLNRPERRNAVSRFVRDALLAALEVAIWDPDLRVHLSGEGPSFSAGGDLDEFGTFEDPASAHLLRTTRSTAWLLHLLRDRTTVDVHGPCAGAGVELAAFAGTVRAAPDTTLLLPELSLGMVPGAGGTVSVTRRIGRWRCAWMVLSNLPVDARTALQWGLVDEIGERAG